MPNWCECELRIRVDAWDDKEIAELVDPIKEFIKSPDSAFDFRNVIPLPGGVDADIVWGARGFDYDAAWAATPARSEVLFFQTAWTPPLLVVEALAKRFPYVTISLEYFEQGKAYCGGVTYCEVEDGDDVPEDLADRTRSWESEYYGLRGG